MDKTLARFPAAALAMALCATLRAAEAAAAAPPAAAAEADTGPEVISRASASPEGPIFVDGTLYVVDYVGHDVLRIRADADNSISNVVWHRDGCGPTGLARVPEGLLVACFDGKLVATIALDGRTLDIIDKDEKGEALREPNDFALAAGGGVYFSGTGPWEPDPVVGKIYFRPKGGPLRTVAADLHSPNGLVPSPDGRLLYVAESFASRLLVFDVAADGSLSGKRVFVNIADVIPEAAKTPFTPDGIRVDGKGNLFVGFWDGGAFIVLSPQGRLLKRVNLPATHNPNLAITPDGASVICTGVIDLPDKSSRGELYRVPNPLAAP
jgi:gluconolactonase